MYHLSILQIHVSKTIIKIQNVVNFQKEVTMPLFLFLQTDQCGRLNKNIQIIIPSTREFYLPWNFVDVLKLEILRWGEYPELLVWALNIIIMCLCKTYKTKEVEVLPHTGKAIMILQADSERCSWEMTQRPKVKACREPPGSEKTQGNRFFDGGSRRNQLCQQLGLGQ